MTGVQQGDFRLVVSPPGPVSLRITREMFERWELKPTPRGSWRPRGNLSRCSLSLNAPCLCFTLIP